MMKKWGLSVSKRFICRSFDHDSQKGCCKRCRRKCCNEWHFVDRQIEEPKVGTQHDHAAVGKVTEVHDTVNQRITNCHQRIHTTDGQAVDQLL